MDNVKLNVDIMCLNHIEILAKILFLNIMSLDLTSKKKLTLIK